MDNTGKADYLIKESGCGPFQVLLVFFVDVLIKFATVYSMMFMAFGSYNPGWRCIDTNTTTSFNNSVINSSLISHVNSTKDDETSDLRRFETTTINDTSNFYNEDYCELFKSCQNIEFNPETSTIVTEWNLVCDEKWVPSFIISMQMAGMLFGSIFAGQMGDTFGRKKTLYASLASLGVLSLCAKFSTYWQVFTAIRFLIGITIACLYNLYNILPAEFLSSVWRVRLAAIPSWQVGGLLFAAASLMLKDWGNLHLLVGGYCLLACLPAIWVPESLRWLEVRKKSKGFQNVAMKMTKLNKMDMSLISCDETMLSINHKSKNEENLQVYTVLDLFRKNYRLYTVVIAFVWIIPAMNYYAISFGVKAMYGDFYINLMILFAADIPFSIVPMYVPNLIGRKRAVITFYMISSIALLIATGFGFWAKPDVKNTGSLILALIAKMNTVGGLSCNIVITAEIYPTVVRSNALGYCNFMARIGGMIAPFLIPAGSQDIHYCYGILGIMCVVCCLLLLKLPETRGRTLKETFDQE